METGGHTFICNSEEQTAALATRMAPHLNGGTYISLEGDLGAGKTFFSRALARSLGISEPITSPTFVLQKSYDVPDHPSITRLFHYDFYRIADYSELIDVGFEDHDAQTLVLAEWGDLFLNDFPVNPVRIQFSTQSDNSRLIAVSGLRLPRTLPL